MSVCTFFGHSECYGLDAAVLRNAIENLIKQGTSEFLVGNHGQFDGMVFSCLQVLSKDYPEISYSVALAYHGSFRSIHRGCVWQGHPSGEPAVYRQRSRR